MAQSLPDSLPRRFLTVMPSNETPIASVPKHLKSSSTSSDPPDGMCGTSVSYFNSCRAKIFKRFVRLVFIGNGDLKLCLVLQY